MKIPKSVRVAGIEYIVEFAPGLSDGCNVFNGEVTYGDTTIRINQDKPSHEIHCVTLWHELLHVLVTHGCLDLGENEEKIVEVLAYGIYQILQDNGGRLFDLTGRGEDTHAENHKNGD